MKKIDLALNASKKWLSPQTGFIQYFPDDWYNKRQDTIPLKENWAYALTLLRMKTQESVLLAKVHMQKLLAYEVEGNFPVYMHEYPNCRYKAQVVFLAPFFYWILKEFSLVIGLDIREKLESIFEGVKSLEATQFSYAAQAILSAISKGSFFYDNFRVHTLDEKSAVLMALQICGESFEGYYLVLEAVASLWDRNQLVYADKSHLFWEGTFVEENLVSLYMQELFEVLCKPSPHPCQLLASIIYPFPLGCLEKLQCKKQMPLRGQPLRGEPLILLHKDGHSLYLESKADIIHCRQEGNKVCLELTFNEGADTLLDAASELVLYFSKREGTQVLMNGSKATTFSLKEKVQFLADGKELISAEIELINGEGSFLGHLMQGNRPHQRRRSGDDLYKAFDWYVGLRTLKRSAPIILKVEFTLNDALLWSVI